MDENTEKRLSTLEINQKEIFSRLNNIELTNGIVSEKLDNIKETQKDLKIGMKDLQDSIKELTDKPSKRWDLIVTTIITVAITAVVAFFIGKLAGK
jgi:chromosome segregation ATPase